MSDRRRGAAVYLPTIDGFNPGANRSEPMPLPCEDHWRRRMAESPFHAAVAFDDGRLVFGRGTLLRSVASGGVDALSLRSDAGHDRMVALLAVAAHGRIAKGALLQLDAALGDWRRGDRGLAAIRLAFAPLPRLSDPDGGYRLFLAETALDAGVAPNELLRELGYSTCATFLKFDQSQPRVPRGSGRRGGQWTSGDAAAETPDSASQPVRSGPPQTGSGPADQAVGFVPVFLRPQPDGEDEVIQDKERRLFREPTEEGIEDGRILAPPLPGPIGPGSVPDLGLDEPVKPTPLPKPTPGGGDPPPPGTKTRDDKGPACPVQQDDIKNGRNFNGDETEYAYSLLINPENPTPKQSIATPNVTSQAYFLPSDTPSGRISFDDCKQSDTPTLLLIPGLKSDDLFELKAAEWGWVLSAPSISGYGQFERQVENQSMAVAAEGKGRQIYYCLGDQTAVSRAQHIVGRKYENSHFLVCR